MDATYLKYSGLSYRYASGSRAPIWFVVRVGQQVVVYRYRDTFPDFAEVQKRLFRADGTPVLAVVRLKEPNSYDVVIRHM